MKKIIAFFLCLVCVWSAGPSKMAKSDRTLWVYPINSPQAFDFASKMEMLVFIGKLSEIEQYTQEQFLQYTQLKKVDMQSIQTYIKNTKEKMINNFKHATLRAKEDYLPTPQNIDWESLCKLSIYATNNLPQELKAWRSNAEEFYEKYLYEQIRLAGLFPSITSEILMLGENEKSGNEMPDKEFLLTFDDGSSKKGGNTDKTIEVLKQLKVGAIFFVLAPNLEKRKDFKDLYQGFLLGSHGELHKPHTKEEVWSNAPQHAKMLSQYNTNQQCFFRPPYGQRSIEFIEALKSKGCEIVFWNIDSQDWSSKMSAPEVLNRVITLSLLWRSGIVLFHDIHPKARSILPSYVGFLRESGAKVL